MPSPRPCPFCSAAPYKMKYSPLGFQVDHKPGCVLRGIHKYIWDDDVDKWNTREPDYEKRYGELVEITSRRITEEKDARHNDV